MCLRYTHSHYSCNNSQLNCSYGYPLVFLTGTDGWFKTVVFAAAAIKTESVDNYNWILSTTKEEVGADAWDRIRVVATDGDQSFYASLSAQCPNVHHLRCSWHIGKPSLVLCSSFNKHLSFRL
jgi:hypothetical protein